MADFASSARSRTGTKFFDGAGKLVALDPAPRMTVLADEPFNSTLGIYTPKASTGVNTGSNPVTNGSEHIYRTSQVSLENGCMTFTPTKEGTQIYSGYADTYPGFGVQGEFAIYSKFLLPYGYGPGAWPSEWGMYGQPHVNWPTNEELDRYEWVHSHTDRLYFTSHYDVPYGSGSSGHQAKPNYAATPAEKNYITGFDPSVWHESLVIARPAIGFEWYLDGNLIYTTNGYNNDPTPRFTKPFYLIANFAIGGTNGFPDSTDGTSGTGAGTTNKFYVDHVTVYRLRAARTTIGGINFDSVTQRADGTDVKLVKADGTLLFPGSTGGGTGGDTGGGTSGGGGTGLPAPGVHALFNDTTSPTRTPIDWTSAVIHNSEVITSSMRLSSGPYVSISDSGCRTYWPSATEVGRLTVKSTGYNAGTYPNIPCPVGAQPSVSGSDGPIQIAVADGRWVDCYAVSGNTITWVGNQGTCTVQGITVKNWQTGTGWATGTVSSYDKFGFAACGATVSAGALTAEDKKLGYIAHALAIVMNNAGLANGPIPPATREDNPNYPSGNTYYHQGTLLAIAPPSRGGPTVPSTFSAWEKAIVAAFTNYGGYVMDRNPGGFTIRCNSIAEPGTGTTLSSSDFTGVQTMASGSCGKFLIDNLRWVTKGKPVLGSAHA